MCVRQKENRHLEMTDVSQASFPPPPPKESSETSLKAADKENDVSISLFYGVRMPLFNFQRK